MTTFNFHFPIRIGKNITAYKLSGEFGGGAQVFKEKSINCALNRPALQSSVSRWSRSQQPAVDASGANNGDLTVPFGCHTAAEDNPWWQVDLLSETVIDRVLIYNRQECAWRLRFFSLLASKDGREWWSFYRRDDPKAFGQLADDAWEVIPETPVTARYVRLQLNGREPLHFRECEVYGHPLAAKNLAAIENEAAAREAALRAGRTGSISKIGNFSIFVDEEYGPDVMRALQRSSYEQPERQLAEKMLVRSDRVLEVGTAIGVVSMAAAACTAPAQVRTFDGNPKILADAKRNFAYNGLDGISTVSGILKNRQHISPSEKHVKFVVSGNFWASHIGTSATGPKGVVIDTPILCLEDEITAHQANVLIIDIEGGEIELLHGADLSSIRLIIMETHPNVTGADATDTMIRNLLAQGFATSPELSQGDVKAFHRELRS